MSLKKRLIVTNIIGIFAITFMFRPVRMLLAPTRNLLGSNNFNLSPDAKVNSNYS